MTLQHADMVQIGKTAAVGFGGAGVSLWLQTISIVLACVVSLLTALYVGVKLYETRTVQRLLGKETLTRRGDG
jgi:ABC-type arginine/histidine transport system permease subunit